jgi:hypothetical protein
MLGVRARFGSFDSDRRFRTPNGLWAWNSRVLLRPSAVKLSMEGISAALIKYGEDQVKPRRLDQ